jgi:transposase-like protein
MPIRLAQLSLYVVPARPGGARTMARPDFPRTLAEFQDRFASEDDCRRYLVACRWPNGFRCPRCGGGDAHELAGRGLLQCRSCRHQTSVTAGTVLHRARVPLRLWFSAAHLVTTHTPGFSALQLQRQLGLGRYETAWTMLQKLRRAMLRPERDRIAGTVEVDETYVGGVEEGRRGGRHRDSTKSIVVGAVEVRDGGGSGRIRLAVVEDLSAASLTAFVAAAVKPGDIVLPDGWQGYAPLRHAYDHRPSTVGDLRNASKLLPRVHRTFSNLKTWLKGTHHGVSAKHLPHYVNEFVFRFNRRRTPMAAFQSLLGLTTQHAPTTHKMLYAAEPTG